MQLIELPSNSIVPTFKTRLRAEMRLSTVFPFRRRGRAGHGFGELLGSSEFTGDQGPEGKINLAAGDSGLS